MSLGSTSDSFKGFYLDRLLVEQADVIKSEHPGYALKFNTGQIPLASPLWKRVLQFPQLGYFNRIFLNQGNIFDSNIKDSIYLRSVDDVIDDNFTVQCMCTLKLSNALKPLGMSFDTFDEDVDNNFTTVNNV